MICTKEANLAKLHNIAKLKQNWDGYEANTVKSCIVDKVKELIERLDVQPEIFPTPSGSIQIEYDTEANRYLEIEMFSSHADLFIIDSDGKEHNKELSGSIEEVIKNVNDFLKENRSNINGNV